ncbi:MAG: hypothetical protein LBS43_11670 [Prevotellaceae bacterium]|jgi:hypothetical protein|nr:hypothetical protein [Prevotellaceae bacterium]
MIAKSKTGIILKASGLALLWVTIISCTMFPELLERGNTFLSEQYIFGDVGTVLLFSLGIYTFDLMIQVLYVIDEHLDKTFLVQILGGVSVCVLAISFTKNMGVSNIYPFLIVGLSMCYMKTVAIYMSDKTKKAGNRKLRIKKIGDL